GLCALRSPLSAYRRPLYLLETYVHGSGPHIKVIWGRTKRSSRTDLPVESFGVDKLVLHLESQNSFLPCSLRNLFHFRSQVARRPFFNFPLKHPSPFVPCAI